MALLHPLSSSLQKSKSPILMTHTPRILAFSGSLRSASWNHLVAMTAASGAEATGADVTLIRLGDHPLPLYDQDFESSEGLPEPAMKLKQLFREHDGFIIGCPEYNGSLTAALKNCIDWVSRPEEGHPSMDGFKGKVAGLVACSPGRLGGIRGLGHVRTILSGIGVHVVPTQIAVPGVADLFDDEGLMTDERMKANLEELGQAVAETARRLRA